MNSNNKMSNDINEEKPLTAEEKKVAMKKEIIEWVEVIVAAVIIAFVLNRFIVVNAKVPSGSMEKTIMTGDRLYGNRLAYLKDDPQRGDVVIFKAPDDESQLYVKRVIGIPGDKVVVIDGLVYINDSDIPLDESSYVTKDVPIGDFGPYEVPEGCYFVMGDNRNNSFDARFWNNTYLHRDKILGKAWFRYYPNPSMIK